MKDARLHVCIWREGEDFGFCSSGAATFVFPGWLTGWCPGIFLPHPPSAGIISVYITMSDLYANSGNRMQIPMGAKLFTKLAP